jgi:hypothetical protein
MTTLDDLYVTVNLRFRVIDLEALRARLDETPARAELDTEQYAEVRADPARAAEELITQLALRETTGWNELGLEA